MSYDAYYQGTAPLQHGVTFTQIAALLHKHTGLGDEPLELDLQVADGEFESESSCVNLYVQDGVLDYNVDENVSGWFDFDGFLAAVEPLARAGWTSYEGQDRDPNYYGPTPLAVAAHRLQVAIEARDEADKQVSRFKAEVAALS